MIIFNVIYSTELSIVSFDKAYKTLNLGNDVFSTVRTRVFNTECFAVTLEYSLYSSVAPTRDVSYSLGSF